MNLSFYRLTFRLFLFLICFLPYGLSAQENIPKLKSNYALSSFYLVDSLNISDFSPADLHFTDSLLSIYHKSTQDTARIKILEKIANQIGNDHWKKYNQLIYKQAKEKLAHSEISTDDKKLFSHCLAKAVANFGYVSRVEGNDSLSIEFYNQSLDIYKEFENKKEESELYNNLGVAYYNQADYTSAIENYNKALLMSEVANDKIVTATLLNNIGSVYFAMSDIAKTEKYYLKGLAVAGESGDKSIIAGTLNSIAKFYESQNKDSLAMNYFKKSLKIREEIGDKELIAVTTIAIGRLYHKLKNDVLALEYCQKGKEIAESINFKMGTLRALIALSTIYADQGNNSKAKEVASKALIIAKEADYPLNIWQASGILYNIYKKENNWKQALEMYELYVETGDTLNKEENQKAAIQQEAKYLVEKKELQVKQLNTDKQLQEVQLQTQRRWMIVMIAILLSLIGFSIVIYMQKRTVGNAHMELVKKNVEIVRSEEQLRKTNEKLLETINYAPKYEEPIPVSAPATPAPEFVAEPSPEPEAEQVVKYKSSALSEELKNELLPQLLQAMNNEKLITDKDFTIVKLADYLKTNQAYVSQIINQEFNQNFNSYLNDHRIKKARIMLSDPANKNLTIEYIASSVGFNSISSFNRAFKKYTGITPSFYLKSVSAAEG